MLTHGAAGHISINDSFYARPPHLLLQSTQYFLIGQMAAKGADMQLMKNNFVKTTHTRQHNQFLSMQQLVAGWVITLTTKIKENVIAASICNKSDEVLINMLLVGDTYQPDRFGNNRVKPAKSIRNNSFRTRVVFKCEFVRSKKFYPTNLLGRKVGLGKQVGQWLVVSNDSGVLAIYIWLPLLNGYNYFP